MNVIDLHGRARRPNLIFVAGLPGAGKSSLIQHLVQGGQRTSMASLSAMPSRTIPLLRGPWRAAVPPAHYLVELKGCEDPTDFVSTDAESAQSSSARVRERIVTVVDAEHLLADFCSHALMRDRETRSGADDTRSVADVLTGQVEAAHVLVLNKLDRIDEARKHGLNALLTALNPDARRVESRFGRLSPQVDSAGALVNGNAEATPGWQCALEGRAFPHAKRFGISTLLYREPRPFHPRRLHAFLQSSWAGVVRGRGFFWIASRPGSVVELSQAGAARRYRAVSTWWAEILKDRAPVPSEVAEFLGVPWSEEFGDRRQDLVFVGVGLDAQALQARLDECLLTDAELRGGRAAWERLEDPFPPWVAENVRNAHLSVH